MDTPEGTLARARLVTWFFIAAGSFLVDPRPVAATAGFAEWEVLTPGGHIIRHTDGWKEEHGDCITSDERRAAAAPGGRAKVHVSHLERWRYYEGLIAGKNDRGFFVFDERSERLEVFADEQALEASLQARAAVPIGRWRTAADGHTEAWFPFFHWRPCRVRLGLESAEAGQTVPAMMFGPGESQCRELLSEESRSLFRRTGWGKACEAKDGSSSRLEDFCKWVLSAP